MTASPTPRASSEPFPLDALRARLRERAAVTADEIADLARELGMPPARLRAVLEFYPDLAHPEPAVRVCGGTSCWLSGGREIAHALAGAQGLRTVHCLGHCDRSPAVLGADGVVRVRCQGSDVAARVAAPAEPPPPPAVRCLAREPIVTKRIGRGDFSSLEAARRDGAWDALAAALSRPGAELLDTLERSGERGRGGSGFPTGRKWRAAAEAPGPAKTVIANGDEGDPGSFIDRLLLERDPHAVLEGMALCAHAVGARSGVVFVRSEYPAAVARMEAAVREARAAGLLGARVLGSSLDFDVRVFTGLGSYVSGEETALLAALEGDPGEVRLRPPYPTHAGLHGTPTVVNNVETLASVPWIVARGAEAYRALGTAASNGTLALCLNAGFPRPGIVEVELGTPLREVIETAGGLACDDETLAAVLLGGPMGSLLRPRDCDVPVCHGAMGARGIRLGHGGLVAIPAGTDLRALLLHLLEFMSAESCGKCLPCRDGSLRARDGVRSGALSAAALDELLDLVETTSLCGFGRGMPGPLRSLLRDFQALGGV